MLVTAIGHAGLAVTGRQATILIDPWFAPDGAFIGSWFPFPDNAHVFSTVPSLPAAVVLSHEHLDHVDAWTLANVAPSVPAIIPRYPSRALRSKVLRAARRPVIEASPWDSVEIATGMRVFFVPEHSPMNHDAAVVVQCDESCLLDLNDARISPAQLRSIRAHLGGVIDVMTIQGAGASWFPICYEYSVERRRELSRQKRQAKFGYVARAIGAVDPAVVLPFAGPPCFLDPELAIHNREMEDGIFPDQQQVTDWLCAQGFHRVVTLLPGDTWDADGPGRIPDRHWDGFLFRDRYSYLEEYAARRASAIAGVRARYPAPKRSLWNEFQVYFGSLLEMSRFFNERIDMRVGFEVLGPQGGAWSIDFRSDPPAILDELGDCAYTYSIESRWLAPILSGELAWEDFLLSLRFCARRDPDVYNDYLLGLLKFAVPEACAAVERFERSMDAGEMIVIRSGEAAYRVQRRCPHAGQDLLETAEVLPGDVLRCLGHHYEFDLATGRCLNGKCISLHTTRLDSSSQEPSCDA
jgi:UDP-MurNAc hydroxylase